MAIADKLLELNDVKQDIKTAIEGKGVSMTGVPFTGYPAKIDSITTGTGTGMSYHDYAKMLFSMVGFGGAVFTEAWTESQNSLEVLFEIPLMLAADNQSLGGKDLDLYVGTDSALTDFYNLVASGEFPEKYAIIINKSVIRYQGDIGVIMGMQFPVYAFGMPEDSPAAIDQFFLADLTLMGMGIAIGKPAGVAIPDNSITVRRGFENYEAGLIIPEMIEIVGDSAFERFDDNSGRQVAVPYLIGPNVKYIGENGFGNLDYRLPLNIPDSVEWIGRAAFSDYSNNHGNIVVPRNVTYIGPGAFNGFGPGEMGYFRPSAIMYSEVPPVIEADGVYGGPFPSYILRFYVPDDAVSAYESAWQEYADRIRPMSALPSDRPIS